MLHARNMQVPWPILADRRWNAANITLLETTQKKRIQRSRFTGLNSQFKNAINSKPLGIEVF